MADTCIFCHKPLNGSDEHIIPESLNGRLHTKELICKACNSRFGQKLDPSLKEGLYVIMHVIGVGKADTIIVTDENGQRYKIDREGKISSEKIDIATFEVDGKIGIRASGDVKKVPKAFAQKLIRQFGRQKALQTAKTAHFKVNRSELRPVHLKTEIHNEVTPRMRLALEKIICEFYALNGLDICLISDRLQRIWNLDEAHTDVQIANKDQQMRTPGNFEVSHLIAIRSEASILYAYVELFNYLCGYVVLTQDYDGLPVDIKYHQDALTGTILNEEINIDINKIQSDVTSFDQLGNSLLKRKRDIEVHEWIKGMCTEIKKQLDEQLAEGKITEDQHEYLYVERTTLAVAELMIEQPHLIEIDPEEDNKNRHLLNYIHSMVNEEHTAAFEEFYRELVGKEIFNHQDKTVYIITGFHYTKQPPHNGKSYVKAYCHLQRKDQSMEKHILATTIFKDIELAFPPEDSPWLH